MSMRVLFLVLGLLASGDGEARDIQPDPVYRETQVRQSRPRLAGEIFDSQEMDPALKQVFAAADRKAERAVGNTQRDSKFIIHFWRAKKRILKDEYGLHWQTPAELNPHVKYASYGQPQITEAEDRILRVLAARELSGDHETIRDIDRSFEGAASVWTRDAHGQLREYRFTGHDETWTFIGASQWEE